MSKSKDLIQLCDIHINSTKVNQLSPLRLNNAQHIVIRDLYFHRIWSRKCQVLKLRHVIDKQWCYFVLKHCDCSGIVELHLDTSFGNSFDTNGEYVLTMLASKFNNLKKLYLYNTNYELNNNEILFTKALNCNVLISKPGLTKSEDTELENLRIGEYSRIIVGTNENSGNLVAVRTIASKAEDAKLQSSRFDRSEIEMMRSIEHDNVVNLIDFTDTSDNAALPQFQTTCLYFVHEYSSKGRLIDYLMDADGLGARVTRTYSHQLLNGLKAIHKAGYVHRDLKPENLLLDDNYKLKIAGFGCIQRYKYDTGVKALLSSTCGTRAYMAPELVKGEKYSHMVDLFAVGIIMFTLFAGGMLFF